MTAPADLEAVKAMLGRALQDAGDGVAIQYRDGERKFAAVMFDNRFHPLFDADKLAATVAEWFAARPEGQG